MTGRVFTISLHDIVFVESVCLLSTRGFRFAGAGILLLSFYRVTLEKQ